MESKELKEKFVDERTGILKVNNQMLWVQSMNNIKNRAKEISYSEIIFL